LVPRVEQPEDPNKIQELEGLELRRKYLKI
jgi:hypothetical protein